ncbi:hypothetical protein I203_100025 [Kwoniella mangroviensis CBS 8507]|uniref:uncharacterized protein n=1 Tax=Kwoniella mangroviensis CBS 8507 TaxID=1296122 RepID=UPI00080CCABE|nr:uncharacterized protein I203_08259 [Kwoniella mangroviensis CBS 8507]OCF62684.1 hypothetical protein I203_08259 [Kwoniella mangroviensis CBS 8507]
MTYLLLPPHPTSAHDVPRSPSPSPSPIFPTAQNQGKLEDPLEPPLPNLEYPFIKDGLEVFFDIQHQEEEEEEEEENSTSDLDFGFGLGGRHGRYVSKNLVTCNDETLLNVYCSLGFDGEC